MDPAFLQKRARMGALYGLIGGLAFAFFTWFLDGAALASSHAAYPFFKTLLGLLMTLPAFVLVGWLASKADNHLLSVFLWLLLCAYCFFVTQYLHADLLPRFYSLMEQPAGALMTPGLPPYFLTMLLTVGGLLMALSFMILGLLQISLVEGVLSSGVAASKLMMAVVVIGLMGMAGSQADYFSYRNARMSITSFDKLIRLVTSEEGQALDEKTKSVRNFHGVSHLGLENLRGDYRFFALADYPGEFGQIPLLLQLGEDQWARCSSVNREPSFCSPVSKEELLTP